MSEWTSEWPSTDIPILGFSEPLCSGATEGLPLPLASTTTQVTQRHVRDDEVKTTTITPMVYKSRFDAFDFLYRDGADNNQVTVSPICKE